MALAAQQTSTPDVAMADARTDSDDDDAVELARPAAGPPKGTFERLTFKDLEKEYATIAQRENVDGLPLFHKDTGSGSLKRKQPPKQGAPRRAALRRPASRAAPAAAKPSAPVRAFLWTPRKL
jgi:hypothetical protein